MRCILFALALFGCSKKTCDDAIKNVFSGGDAAATVFGFQPAQLQLARRVAAEDCKGRPWTEHTIECLAKAKDGEALQSCARAVDLKVFHERLVGELDPDNVRRDPMLDALVTEVASAVTVIPTADVPADCPRRLAVEIVDDALAKKLSERAKPEYRARAVGHSLQLARYAAQARLDERAELEHWAQDLALDHVWGFVEVKTIAPKLETGLTFQTGVARGVIRIVDPRKHVVICAIPFSAESSKEVDTMVYRPTDADGNVRKGEFRVDMTKSEKAAQEAIERDFYEAIDKAAVAAVAKLR
jgi:hypothetical protein